MKQPLLYLILFLHTVPCFAFGSKAKQPSPPSPPPSVDCGKYISRAEWQEWADDIKKLGGRVPDEFSFAATPAGYKKYLAMVGTSSQRANEMTIPANASAAKSCGIGNMLPTQCIWIRGAAMAMWADHFASVSGGGAKIRNWCRSSCYNQKVGGASGSDHIQGRAADIYFDSQAARRKVQRSLCSMWSSGKNMQVGMGGEMLHVGFESPRGQRFWYYGSYSDADKNTNCIASKKAALQMLAPPDDLDHTH